MAAPASSADLLGASRARHVIFLNWRDTRNPEGGGSERYVESVARGLVAAGSRVTVFCAAHELAPSDEVDEGVRFVRRGGKLSVYTAAAATLLSRRLQPFDVVVDVQNGVPFLSRLFTRRPVIVLVHHVHREQWPVVYGRTVARFGWWLESTVAPRVYRGCQYVAVSDVTKTELVELGVRADDVAVVHNGTDPVPDDGTPRDLTPTVCVLGRLVPHKRVEHALRAIAALRDAVPGLHLLVVGDGWWSDELRAETERLGIADLVEFTGFVSEADKHRALARAWVLAAPSLKEGWGLCVMEAAAHAVPTVAYRNAGGLSESVVDGVTGVLVDDDEAAFAAGLLDLLEDDGRRESYGRAAQARATTFTWEQTAASFSVVVGIAVSGREPLAGTDPVPPGRPAPAATTVRVRPARLRRRRSGRQT